MDIHWFIVAALFVLRPSDVFSRAVDGELRQPGPVALVLVVLIATAGLALGALNSRVSRGFVAGACDGSCRGSVSSGPMYTARAPRRPLKGANGDDESPELWTEGVLMTFYCFIVAALFVLRPSGAFSSAVDGGLRRPGLVGRVLMILIVTAGRVRVVLIVTVGRVRVVLIVKATSEKCKGQRPRGGRAIPVLRLVFNVLGSPLTVLGWYFTLETLVERFELVVRMILGG